MEAEVVATTLELKRRRFDDLCKRLRPRLRAWACRMTDSQEVDDIVQQALISAWAVHDRLNWSSTDSEVFAWLRKFVTYSAREQRRSSSRRRSREAPPDSVPLPDDYLQLSVPDTTAAKQELDLLESRELVRLLRGAKFTGRQRECVIAWASGESQHAIARRLNLRSATVWQHIEAAVFRMRQLDCDASYMARAAYFQEQGRRGYTAPEPVGARIARERLALLAHHDAVVNARCRRRRYRCERVVRDHGNPHCQPKVAGSRGSATGQK